MPTFIHVPAQIDKVFEASSSTATTASSITYSAVPFGGESPTREIFVVFATRSISGYLPTAVTIGGVSATIETVSSSLYGVVACAHAFVPTGTSGDVVITMANNVSSSAIAVYRVADRATVGATADDYASATISSAASASLTGLDVSSGGFVLAGIATDGTLSAPGGAGLSVAIDATQSPGSTAKVFASTPIQSASSTGNTITLSWTSNRSGAAGAWAFH